MKKLHILLTILVTGSFISCTKEAVPLFQDGVDGVYFANDASSKTYNFADSVLTDAKVINDTATLNLMGYVSTQDRYFVLKTKHAKDSLHVLSITLPDRIVLPANAKSVKVPYQVIRPDERQQAYSAIIYVDPADNGATVGKGIKESSEYTIIASESYSQPEEWNYFTRYYGPYSVDKYIFLTRAVNSQNLFSYSNVESFNKKAVNAMRAYNDAHPDALLTYDFPLRRSDYNKPGYWNADCEKYLGAYTGSKVLILANLFDMNTGNEYVKMKLTDSNGKEFNKQYVNGLLQDPNGDVTGVYVNMNNPSVATTKSLVEDVVPMFSDVDYTYAQPCCWTNNVWTMYGPMDQNPTYIKKYYGDYSNAKYKFMCETMNKGPWAMFPVYATVDWSIYGLKQRCYDENLLKECNTLFKAKLKEYNDAHSSSPYTFTFPDI